MAYAPAQQVALDAEAEIVKQELKVSPFDKVYSGLMAALVLGGALVLLLFMIWLGKQVVSTQVGIPVVPIIVDNETGGFEHGVEGESIELPGPVTGELGFGADKVEPQLQETLEAVASVVKLNTPQLAEPLPTQETKWSTGGVGGSRGTGNAPALGLGGGSGGGVRRAQRWLIEFEKGGNIDDYAKQLDFFKVELGVIGGSNQIEYAANLLKPKPDRRASPGDKEERLYFSWRDGSLQQADRELLARAGIPHNGKLVVQFYPKPTEDLLAFVEDEYLKAKGGGRSIKRVRQTKFKVRTKGAGYEFVVTGQTYLGG